MELAKTFLRPAVKASTAWAAKSPLIASHKLWSGHGGNTAAAANNCNEVEKLAIDKANKKPSRESEDDRIDDSVQFGAHELSDEEIEDHDRGVEAGLAGKPNDDTKSAAWQRGWADAQE